ncbi:sec1 family domain-containing protein 2-like [Diprion similis]|uniref:sec1 family domain-containing protein 2-like n=1 Tax=Diprion similis TaxID=362088 RepID=UPI001EF7D359|nr:sec1 family domain-containing protein 2-like [Diprion similis]XP_046740277.1 sec1 family domain-containing protein 2-like [Diprion similis]
MDNRVKYFTDNCWKDFFQHVNNAVVYIDKSALECLHWYTGDNTIKRLQYAGVVAVRELLMHNFGDAEVKKATKAVFVYTSANPDFYQHTLETIINMNRFQECTIICAAHSSVLKYGSNSKSDYIDSYDCLKHDVIRWMSSRLGEKMDQAPVATIMFRPIFIASINENLFVTPPFWKLMPPFSTEDRCEEFKENVDHFVSSLHSMFTNFNLREDIYYFGQLSENVAEKLEKLPAAVDRRKRLTGKTAGVSLILVDRTLDLCVASSHNTESLLGKILSTLPRLPDHQNDIAVDMTVLGPNGDGVENYPRYSAPGCLASNDSNMINQLMKNKQKDVLITLHKLLSDILLSKESPKTRIATRITAHSLEKLVHKLRNVDDLSLILDSSKKLQQVLAVIQALKSNKTSQIELIISLEKLILQNLAVSRDSSSILAQLSNIIKTRATRGLSIENLLGLLVYIYALAGTEIRFIEQQEKQLEEALAEAIYEDGKHDDELITTSDSPITNLSSELFGERVLTEEMSTQIANDIMAKLHRIAEMRKSLQKYKSLMLKPSPQEMAQCIGILQQLVMDLLDPERPEVPDLQCKTFSRITAGFNLLLKGRTKQHPLDNDYIIIYVLGGIVAEEIKIVQDMIVSKKPSSQIIIAGSRLLNPCDVTNHILLKKSGSK